MEDQIYNTLSTVAQILIMLCGIKAIWGFHFPWERCNCCGKHCREHDVLEIERLEDQ